MPRAHLENQACIQNRVLFKTGFYSKQGSIQNPASIQNRLLFKTGFYMRQAFMQDTTVCEYIETISLRRESGSVPSNRGNTVMNKGPAL